MDNKSNSRATTKKTNINIAKILRRPIVRLAILIILIIVIVCVVRSCSSNKEEETTNLVGYQKLVDVTDNTYTYVDLEGKVRTYEGYTSMDDFYYDTTCVSKVDDDGVTQMALISKKEKQIVKYGTYDNFTQIVGGKFYKVEQDGKYGVITKEGKVIIEPQYEYISITTVQEATEVVFECQQDGKYTFVNENGDAFYETDVALHSISYANKFNSEYDTIINISVDGQKKYFNLATGEELFTDIEDVNISYNILTTEEKICFYDKEAKLKTELDTSSDYSSDARVYFKKYVVVEQKNVSSGTRECTYTVYDSDFKKVVESENKISPVQDIDGNVYFIINETDSVRIINENKKEIEIEGYEFNGNNISNLQYLVLNPIDDVSTYDVFTFKGKAVKEDAYEYSQKGFGLIIQATSDSGENERLLMLGNSSTVTLTDEDEIVANDYYLTIENSKDNVVSVVDRDGEITVDKVTGTKLFYVENYIGIEDGDTVNVYDVETGKLTFTYASSEYVNRDETVNVIELQSGYYTFDGNTVLEK